MHITVDENDALTGIFSRAQSGSIEVADNDARVLAHFGERAKAEIDEAAGACRLRFVSPGAFLSAEYELAETEAKAYAEAEYAGEVPASVQAHADALGGTAQEAADAIIATGVQWRAVLNAIRAIRLTGKANVDAATTKGMIDSAVTQAKSELDAVGA